MVRCERFVIEYDVDNCGSEKKWGNVISYKCYPVIYDRVNKRKIIKINIGDDEINDEIAERVLTMLNIKFMGE